MPEVALESMRSLGLFRLRLPREVGGLGWSHGDFGLAAAALARESLAAATWVCATQSVGALPALEARGTPGQKARWRPLLAEGFACLAAGEEGAGSALARTAARARPAPGGGWRLDGRKAWVTLAPRARVFLVLAREDGAGLSAFLVRRGRGVRVGPDCRFMGLRGLPSAAVEFRGARAGSGDRLAAAGEGASVLQACLAAGRPALAARALGASGACLRAARAWAAARGLAARPAAAALLARAESAHAAVARAEAELSAAADRGPLDAAWSARRKVAASEAAWEAADACLQLRGARGYETGASQAGRGEKPVPLERIVRDLRALRLMEGPNEVLASLYGRPSARA